MSYLNRIKHHPKAVKKNKRVGRGPGSGHGKTSGKGHKGQGQHGAMPRAGFEGGQMPLIRTTPKRGFSARSVAKFQVLNLSDLSSITASGLIDSEYLFKHRFIDTTRVPVKILGDGELKHALHVKAHAFSKSAVEKIEKAGGKVERVEVKAHETKAEAAVRVGAKAKK